MSSFSFDIIAALDEELGIGKSGGLAWSLPGDTAYFMRMTRLTSREDVQNAVIMGRRTWESIPTNFRPLPDRVNIVLTRNQELELPPDVVLATSLEASLESLQTSRQVERRFVIGGGALYREAIAHPGCRRLYLTLIEGAFGCDTFFPPYEDVYEPVSLSDPNEENGVVYRFAVYERKER